MRITTILLVTLLFLVLYFSVWIFNHFDPWLGIILAGISVWTTIRYIIKHKNKKE